MDNFKQQILQGIPTELPNETKIDKTVSHAPIRKDILNHEEKKLAVKNALRYFPEKFHATLAPEFAQELKKYGHIYMYRFRPQYKMFARNINQYPHKSPQAAAIMMMIQNNLDPKVAQHPHELITYGGNGSVFSNWAQYLLTMQYLAQMTNQQTLTMYSGHPMGLFPSHKNAPRVVVANGMTIPNYSKPQDWEKYYALGISQYGQMTAGSYMYIGPQGIVHGTTITVLNAGRKIKNSTQNDLKGLLFVTSGMGGMSGAQPKAAKITGCVSITAEINPKAAKKRLEQNWIDELHNNVEQVIDIAIKAKKEKKPLSLGYIGNIVDLWEKLAQKNIKVELGSDQTSLHNPWSGGYYPAGLSFEQANDMMVNNPQKFKEKVEKSLQRQVNAINKLTKQGMYFWDYGNAFMLEAKRAKANITTKTGKFKYPSYVEDIMGPMFFDYGFGPFRWVCTSADPKDLEKSDKIALNTLINLEKQAPEEIKSQLQDNIKWIKEAGENKLVVGSQARILYADALGRTKIAEAFNKAIKNSEISAPIVLGRDHHDVSGTDSPFRETANIYDGSMFLADMAIQNVIGDAFRGATWVSIHNGGGVGWGEVINGGFGMMIDGSEEADKRLKMMLSWDVNNGISRRAWARNKNAIFAIKREMQTNTNMKITIPKIANNKIIENLKF